MSSTHDPQLIQPADLFRLKSIRGPQLSPDGAMLAYAVACVDSTKDEEHAAIWLQSIESGVTRQLTSGLTRDYNPQWSPDGSRLAFLSTRGGDDKAQIYLIPVDGGEAEALTALKQGVQGGPAWSPDGKTIAFTAGPAAEAADPKTPYRVTRHTYRFDVLGYLEKVVGDVYVVASAGGEPKALTTDRSHNTMPQWSPDGQEILYTATMFPDSHRGYYPRLRVVNLEGEIRELVGEWGYAWSAAWTPDGERVVFYGGPHGRPIGSKSDLWVIDKLGGTPECRSTNLKYEVGGGLQPDIPLPNDFTAKILVSPDGQTAYTQVQAGGTVQVYQFALSGPERCTPIIGGDRSCLPLDLGKQHLLFGVSTLNSPAELFSASADGSQERQLTHINDELLLQRRQPAVEHLLFPSADGTEVEGWLLKPTSGQAPYPTILYIHGGPHSAFGHVYSFDFQMLAGAGYAVLFINHRGSTGYGNDFATKILGDWGNWDYTDLMAGVDFAIAKGLSDPNRLGCCGLSGGGNLSCWIVGQTDRFKAAVPENPVTNWVSFYGVSDIGPWFAVEELKGLPHVIPEVYQRCSPITYAHRCKTPTLLIQGEADYRCPAEQSEQFYAVLKASGCVVEMLRLPASSHAGTIMGSPLVRRVHNDALLDWMNKYVLENK